MKLLDYVFPVQERTDLHKFIEISSLSESEDLFDQIQNEQVDGVIIKNVLTKAEVDKMLAALELQTLSKVGAGYLSYPQTFTLLSKENKEEAKSYFRECKNMVDSFEKLFEVDINKSVLNVLQKLDSKRALKYFQPEGFDGIVPPFTFRKLSPGANSNLRLHVGNEFQQKNLELFGFDREAVMLNQLSFFIMLQKPTSGGELSVYDFKWPEYSMKDNEFQVRSEKGGVKNIKNKRTTKKRTISPDVGDMLLFSGGNIWHRVEPIGGSIPRITFGGFLCSSLDNRRLYTWS